MLLGAARSGGPKRRLEVVFSACTCRRVAPDGAPSFPAGDRLGVTSRGTPDTEHTNHPSIPPAPPAPPPPTPPNPSLLLPSPLPPSPPPPSLPLCLLPSHSPPLPEGDVGVRDAADDGYIDALPGIRRKTLATAAPRSSPSSPAGGTRTARSRPRRSRRANWSPAPFALTVRAQTRDMSPGDSWSIPAECPTAASRSRTPSRSRSSRRSARTTCPAAGTVRPVPIPCLPPTRFAPVTPGTSKASGHHRIGRDRYERSGLHDHTQGRRAAELVWKAWTDCAYFSQWWGPTEFTTSHCTIDARPGGDWISAMRSPEGHDFWSSDGRRAGRAARTGSTRASVTRTAGAYRRGVRHDRRHADKDRITVTMEERDRRTQFTMVQGIPRDVAERNGAPEGWAQSFDKPRRTCTSSSAAEGRSTETRAGD